MAKFEPKIEHFFMIVSSEHLIEDLKNNVDYIEEVLYYTSKEQENSVLKAFMASNDRKNIFKGLGMLMPLSSDLIKMILAEECKNLNDCEIIEAYQWLDNVSKYVLNDIKTLKNYVNKNKILEPFEIREKAMKSNLEDLCEEFEQLEEYNQKFVDDRAEKDKLESAIEELKKEQQEGYWEQKKQELKEIKIQLENAKTKYHDDCKQLEELQKELDSYQSGNVNKKVAEYLKTLHKLSEQLPNDEVN